MEVAQKAIIDLAISPLGITQRKEVKSVDGKDSCNSHVSMFIE